MHHFIETQHFRQPWIWLLVLLVTGTAVLGLVTEPFEWPMAFFVLIPLFLMWLIGTSKLETLVDENGVYFRFAPFHLKPRYIPWGEIREAYVRKYGPIREFGGWGIRWGIHKGMAYNVSGNRGLQLHLTNGKKILIGTRNPEELDEFLKKIRKQFENEG